MTKLVVIEKATGKEVFDRKCSKRNAEHVKARLHRTMFDKNDYEIAVAD